MAKCPKCGRDIEKEGHRCCNACSIRHDAIRRGEGGIHWEYRVPVVANAVLWREILFAVGIPVLIIAVIVVLFSNAPDRLMVVAFFAALYAVLLLIALIMMVALARSLGGGLLAKFYVNNAGVGFEAGSDAKTLSHGILALSFMSGVIDAAATNFLAIAQEENFIAWRDVSGVKVYLRQRVILIRSLEQVNPLALYCTPENFNTVTDMISKKVPRAIVRS